MSTLGEDLRKEIQRNQELLAAYAAMPPQSGWFGKAAIQADLDEAVAAVSSGDVLAVLRSYEKLKANE